MIDEHWLPIILSKIDDVEQKLDALWLRVERIDESLRNLRKPEHMIVKVEDNDLKHLEGVL